jgi:hypothetical protein
MRERLLSVGIVCLLLVLPLSGLGQTSNGALTGLVEDPSKALIPGVTITATNVETGVETTVITNESGSYNIPSLLPGVYKLSAELSGFRGVVYNNIELGTGETKRFNFTLNVGGVSTTVDVSIDAGALLTASTATIDNMLPENKVRDLPLVGNNVLDLIGVLGGARVSSLGGDFTTFAGISAQYLNTTVNGQSVSDGRYEAGIYSTTRINPDMVSEVRLVLTPVDAEMGRGNGQVQIQTRSGTSQYRGSAVWNVRNTALDARSWYDDRTVPLPTRNWQNQHQYTLSYGGPIVKNKTFFFALYDGQLTRIRSNVASLVLTDCARNGIFRYFPDWNNGNFNQITTANAASSGTAAIAVVDALGNPKMPATFRNGSPYTGTLQYASVFGKLPGNLPAASADCSNIAALVTPSTPWDTNRQNVDPTGFTTKILGVMPHANAFNGGDGLNTANIQWVRRQSGNEGSVSGGTGNDTNRGQVNIRIDHNFNQRHKLFVSWQYERDNVDTSPPAWEKGFWGTIERRPQVWSANVTSTLSSNLVNEASFGVRRNTGLQYEALDNPNDKAAARAFFPTINGLPVIVGPGAGTVSFQSSLLNFGDFTRGNITTLLTYKDTVGWTKGKHAFRFGGEFRPEGSLGWSNLNFIPHATGGASAVVPLPDFTTPQSLGLLTTNSGTMGNLLTFLSGSIGTLNQLYFLKDAKHLDNYIDLRSADRRGSNFHHHEYSAFFKDDWKASKNLTLNLGLRWEYYGSPWDVNGLTPAPIGGGLAAFGISGRGFDTWLTPGQRGDLTTFEFVGPNSPNPGKSLYSPSKKDFGPAVGFAWQVPWFGAGKTTVRGGYQITYESGGRSLQLDTDLAYAPGMIFTPNLSAADNTFVRLTDITNPSNCGGGGCVPVPTNQKPMQPVPVEFRQNTSGWTAALYDPNYKDPYIQNFTLAVTHSINKNMSFDIRYIGTRGVRLFDTLPIDINNFVHNGLKDAFDSVRAGEESTLLDQMFRGMNIAGTGCSGPGTPCGPVGMPLNGVMQTGAMHLRASTTFASNLANGNYSGMAGSLNTLNYNRNNAGNSALPVIPISYQGAVLRQNNFPENFISPNPQFSSISLRTNLDTSRYHGMQAQFNLRPTQGISYQGTFTWSTSMGSPPNGGFADPTDRREYGLLFGHRSFDFRSNGGFELPIGPGKFLLSNSHGVLARIVEGWQSNLIFQMTSGRPNTIGAQSNLYQGTGTPVVTPEGVAMFGKFPHKFGHVNWDNGAQAGSYFAANMFVRVTDPQCAGVTALQNLNGGASPRCTLQALARALPAGKTGVIGQNGVIDIGSGQPGVIVLRNPLPGERGTLGLNTMEGPGLYFLSAAMSKTFKIDEKKSLQFRVDATNVLNHPTPDDPGQASCGGGVASNLSLNSNTAFGQIGGKCVGESPARRFQASARINF